MVTCVIGDNVECRLCDMNGYGVRESASPDWVVMVTCVISDYVRGGTTYYDWGGYLCHCCWRQESG